MFFLVDEDVSFPASFPIQFQSGVNMNEAVRHLRVEAGHGTALALFLLINPPCCGHKAVSGGSETVERQGDVFAPCPSAPPYRF